MNTKKIDPVMLRLKAVNEMKENKCAQQLNTVEEFKTNVQYEEDARLIINILEEKFPEVEINFDLDDCDKVMRLASDTSFLNMNTIMDEVRSYGFSIEPLP